MALRLNTIEYAFPQTTATQSFAAGAIQQFSQITVTIPETTNRTFISAYVDVFTQDMQTAAASPTSRNFDFRVGGTGGYLKNLATSTLTNSGEHQSYHFLLDVSSQFITNFTGTSQVVDASFSIATIVSNNTSCKLVITYQWDDVDNNRIKTVRIPIESSTGGLNQILQNPTGGTYYQIPLLDTFLPEASKAYKDIFFETWTNEGTNTAATPLNPHLSFALNSEAGAPDASHANTQISARAYRRIWQRKDLSTNTYNQFKAKTDASANMAFYTMPTVLNVTYTYWEPSTSRVLNSVVLAGADEVGYPGATTSTSLSRFSRPLHISENNPVLKQSGVFFSLIDSGTSAVGFNVKVGNQPAFTKYNVMPAGIVGCGGFYFMHNFDSSSRGGQGLTLSNVGQLVIDWYTDSVTAGSTGTNVSALLYLNYECDKSTLPGGSANHMHTVVPLFFQQAVVSTIQQLVTKSPIIIPENNYWISGIVPTFTQVTYGTSQTPSYVVFSAQRDSSTDWGAGWEDLYVGTISMSSEVSPMLSFARARDSFWRWPDESDTYRMDLEQRRVFKYQKPLTAQFGSYWYITYHTMITNVNGTVTGYQGDGSNIYIEAHDETAWDDMMIYEGSTNIGGTFAFPWYNPSINILVSAYENTTHSGIYRGPVNASANITFQTSGISQTSWVF